ncbi:uncharacterized protein BT62DRAFT_926190 [Guyanagaster necrorhizus]|uniref:Uncharacterized protein n=1 Tax=Guyanagaster necrorhizus TaxID=856835 RepID=A0A9P8AY14_9AGAR|nr:uncharacterized protein BT62DRAFT_926190 [Guyanagaster necrorhizus MCA 3950]KAG7451985.1 hypothetical protein BT62DRAFT_926190 [Guyanagaster necrorhizus MCA 3950]
MHSLVGSVWSHGGIYTSLAAPTGDASQDETGFPSSSSSHHIASRRGSFNIARSDAESVVQKRDGLIGALVGLFVDLVALLTSLAGKTCSSPSAASAETVEGSTDSDRSASAAADLKDNAQSASQVPACSTPSALPMPRCSWQYSWSFVAAKGCFCRWRPESVESPFICPIRAIQGGRTTLTVIQL